MSFDETFDVIVIGAARDGELSSERIAVAELTPSGVLSRLAIEPSHRFPCQRLPRNRRDCGWC